MALLRPGIGKEEMLPRANAAGSSWETTSTASCRNPRTWRARVVDAPEQLPTPGACTSTPTNRKEGQRSAIFAVVSPCRNRSRAQPRRARRRPVESIAATRTAGRTVASGFEARCVPPTSALAQHEAANGAPEYEVGSRGRAGRGGAVIGGGRKRCESTRHASRRRQALPAGVGQSGAPMTPGWRCRGRVLTTSVSADFHLAPASAPRSFGFQASCLGHIVARHPPHGELVDARVAESAVPRRCRSGERRVRSAARNGGPLLRCSSVNVTVSPSVVYSSTALIGIEARSHRMYERPRARRCR